LDTRRRARLLASALTVALVVWHVYDLSPDGLADRGGRLKGADFLQFYTYGQLVATGNPDRIYDPAAHAEMARTRVDQRLALTGLRPNHAPVVAWLAALLTGLPFLRALLLFAAASVLTYLAAVAGLARQTSRLRADIGTVIAVAVSWPALYVTLRYGQVSAVALALVAVAAMLFARSQMVASGLVLGLLVYKPNLLVVPVLVFPLTRHWRPLAGLLAGAAAEMALSLSLAGPAVMRQYVDMLVALARHPELVQMYPAESHSLRGAARLLAPWPPLVDAIGVLAIPVAVWLTVRVWRMHPDWRPRWASLVTAMLLASPHLLTYDLLIVAVPVVLVMDWLLERHGHVPPGAWRWGLALLFVGAWPGPLMAEIYQVQVSTLGMSLMLWRLGRPHA
jgi:alpha-1,2-mannosyltransferase